jgi:hypothetical protein
METPLRVPKLSLKLMEVVPNDFVIFRVDQTNPNSEYYLFVGYAHIRLYSKTSMNEMNLCPESCVFFNSSVNSTWMKVVAKAYSYNKDMMQYHGEFKYNGVAEVIIDKR